MTAIPLIAVVGNPNAGKSALFNMLTGARQKVGNYPGVTVERKSGRLSLPDGRPAELVDLPGAYSLEPSSPDEAVTRDVVLGCQNGERLPDALRSCTTRPISTTISLRAAIDRTRPADSGGPEHGRSGPPRRLSIDVGRLSAELGVPVVETVAVRRRGLDRSKKL
jgi:ferrous iron transport protein B